MPAALLSDKTDTPFAARGLNEDFNRNVTIGKLLLDGLIRDRVPTLVDFSVTPLGIKVLERTSESGMSIPHTLRALEKTGELREFATKVEPSAGR